ncbi:uncharacterized protein DUF664 [Mumia flava]|uniref:Uncharacterized protein DUF664 n=1 Tax=Mumia flava TaxID=1348852 RepID=A0A0B2BAZ4_9ACTN|nr:DUF664 domain-containing protein [Mumia flava]PJJ53946.1 uncharacterized protein DUF664 [Mumia flava]
MSDDDLRCTRTLLLDQIDRLEGLADTITDGLAPDVATARPGPRANSIAWLLWHSARVLDDHTADLAGTRQAWTEDGWVERFGLPFAPDATGFGHGPEEVAAVRSGADDLAGYHRAATERVRVYVRTLDADELDRIVDTRWDPPVTAGVRIVSMLGDSLQHLGQAAYVRGLTER